MNRERQIEEMAVILTDGGCTKCNCDENGKFNCLPMYNAELLYNAGYRKQSEVARELFDEIEKLVSANKKTVGCATYEETIFYIEDFIEDLAELKKKYTERKEDKSEN